jgi:tetratricopeptide (TPR) repeat protein
VKPEHLLTFTIILFILTACGSSAAGYNNQGNRDYEAEKYTEAINNYTLAKRENPDLPEPYYNSGNTFHRQGKLEAAVAQTQQSLRTAKDELAEQSHYNLGNSYFKMEDWPKAIEAYKQALRLNPEDQDAKHNLELALQMLRQQQQMQQQGGQQGQQNQQQQQGGQGQQQQQQGGGQPQQGQGQQGNQQQQGQGQQNQQQQGGGNGEQQQDQQSPSGGSSSQDQEQQSGNNGRELSQEEAEQLLDALGQNSQTLQERLNQSLGDGSSSGGFGGAPKPLPAQDW